MYSTRKIATMAAQKCSRLSGSVGLRHLASQRMVNGGGIDKEPQAAAPLTTGLCGIVWRTYVTYEQTQTWFWHRNWKMQALKVVVCKISWRLFCLIIARTVVCINTSITVYLEFLFNSSQENGIGERMQI